MVGPVDPASKADTAGASAFQKQGLTSELIHQAAGLALVLVVAIVTVEASGGDEFVSIRIDAGGRVSTPSAWQLYAAKAARFVAAWALVFGLGQDLVRLTLERCRAIPAPSGSDDQEPTLLDAAPRLGRVIGVLERLLIVTLVLQSAWVGIGLIVAAKSIARFKELEEQRFSEYYLVGTLTSLMVAVVVGLVMSAPVAV